MSFQVHEKWDEISMDFGVMRFSCCAISVIVHITGDYYKKQNHKTTKPLNHKTSRPLNHKTTKQPDNNHTV